MGVLRISVVLAKCALGGAAYGIRFEQTGPREYLATWSFVVHRAEGRSVDHIHELLGNIGILSGFRGCPHCGASSFFKCGCGKVACWNGSAPEVTCPWCERRGKLEGRIDALCGGPDRW